VSDFPKVRVREPRREGQQVVIQIREDSLPLEHPARLLWEVFGMLDLKAFTAGAKAVQGTAAGALKSRRMLLTLWGYALVHGIAHAREIEGDAGAHGRPSRAPRAPGICNGVGPVPCLGTGRRSTPPPSGFLREAC
jgi:hypothetical protein